MAHLYSRVILNTKKEQSTDPWDTLDESQKHVVSQCCILYGSILMT